MDIEQQRRDRSYGIECFGIKAYIHSPFFDDINGPYFEEFNQLHSSDDEECFDDALEKVNEKLAPYAFSFKGKCRGFKTCQDNYIKDMDVPIKCRCLNARVSSDYDSEDIEFQGDFDDDLFNKTPKKPEYVMLKLEFEGFRTGTETLTWELEHMFDTSIRNKLAQEQIDHAAVVKQIEVLPILSLTQFCLYLSYLHSSGKRY